MTDPYIGQICAFGFNFAPRGWSLCAGQVLPVNQNQALFSLLGNTYGGDGITTFALPDLRGRVVVGQGHGPNLTNRLWGEKLGTEDVILTEDESPIHNHNISLTGLSAKLRAVNDDGEVRTASGNSLANPPTDAYSPSAPNVDMKEGSVTISGTATCADTGGSQPHTNMQPYLAVNYCIAVQGMYPPRN